MAQMMTDERLAKIRLMVEDISTSWPRVGELVSELLAEIERLRALIELERDE